MKKDKTLAGILSFLIPGLGQMYSGQFNRGLLFLGGAVASYMSMVIGIGFILYPALVIWAIIDAVKCAEEYKAPKE